MATPHIHAELGDFAKVVLMPGDPQRAKWIADTYLHDVKLVSEIRGMLAFTGYTKNNKRISVMASGMGMPSIAIYSYELFSSFGVESIIRVGTCGSYQEDIHLKDVLICEGAVTDSNFMTPDKPSGVRFKEGTEELILIAANEAKASGIPFQLGNIYSADVFYDVDPNFWKKWQRIGCMGVEMEAYALYMTAERTGKKALAMLTVTDNFNNFTEKLTSYERAFGLSRMIELSIKVAEKLA